MKKKYPEPWKTEKSKYYYFTHTDRSGKQVQKSTKEVLKERARDQIRQFIDLCDYSNKTFRQYQEPFFTNKCPRVERRRDENKPVGETHIKASRAYLDNYILKDPIFPELVMEQVKRGDILDLRRRLKNVMSGINSLNKAINTVKTIFSEAEFREDIPGNPGRGIGHINYKKQVFGYFASKEIKQLLQREYWPNDIAYAVFYTAAHTGMRSGEVLALSWGNVSNVLKIHEAFKTNGKDSAGLPKWEKTRDIPIGEKLKSFLDDYKSNALHINDNDLVFCWNDGSRIGATAWREWFYKAVVDSKIGFVNYLKPEEKRLPRYYNIRGERVKPHCLRHSLNTNLLDAGADPLLVQMYLGWSPEEGAARALIPVLTKVQKGYTHLSGELLKPIADKIDELY